jgi:hypothetical protein
VEVIQKTFHKKYDPKEHGFFGLLSTRDNEKILLELSGKSIINGEVITFRPNPD